MLQNINGKFVYVVEFDTMPVLPITGMTEEEAQDAWYRNLFNRLKGPYFRVLLIRPSDTGDYARALTNAIETGVITEPGKYGIHIEKNSNANWRYDIFKINE